MRKMTNDVKKKATETTALTTATTNFYEQYGAAATQRRIVGSLLKFNKFGEFTAGQEERPIPHGTELAAYMGSLSVGYIRWQDNQPVEYAMGLVGNGFIPPKRSELGHHDQSQWEAFDDGRPRDPWQFANSLILVEPQTEELFTFSSSSKGGLGAVGELAKTCGKHMRTNPGEEPLIALGVGSYQHNNRAYGEIRYPVLKVTGWVSLAELPALDAGLLSDSDQQALAPPKSAVSA
jgi:hypothetical protein